MKCVLIKFKIIALSIFAISACSQTVFPSSNTSNNTPTDSPSPTQKENPAEVDITPTETIKIDDLVINASGVVLFQDNLAAFDMILVAVQGFSQQLSDMRYIVWLLGDDGTAENVGTLQISTDGSGTLSYTSPTGENLLAAHNRVEITLENDGATVPSENVVVDGSYTQEELVLLRTLMVRNNGSPPTPRSKPFVEGVKSEFNLALQHIQNAVNANAIGASDQALVHLEHVINIIDGSGGSLFRDYTQDDLAENPGDGFGMLPYVRQVSEKLDMPEISLVADELETQIFDLQMETIAIIDIGPTTESLEKILSMGNAIHNGTYEIFIKLIQQGTALELRPIQ